MALQRHILNTDDRMDRGYADRPELHRAVRRSHVFRSGPVGERSEIDLRNEETWQSPIVAEQAHRKEMTASEDGYNLHGRG